jgi:ABC-2 type transport system permease protein
MREMLLRIRALVRKELLAILKDPTARVLLFGPAIVQTLVFGYAATFDLSDVRYALLDQSHSQASSELVARLDGTGVFHRVATLANARQIRDVIDSGNALLVLGFSPTFASDLEQGRDASVQVIADGRNSNTAGSAVAYVAAIVQDFNARNQGAQAPINVQARAWFNPNLQTRWNLVPALVASLSMLQTLLLTALSVAREREEGTFDQLLVTPLSPLEIMAGKALPPVLIGLAQSTLVLCVSLFWFRIPFAGSILTLYAGLAIFTTASVGIGLSISALSASMQQAMLYTFVLVAPMMLLSGLTTPVENMPRVLRIATLANPLRFAIDLVRRVYLEGVGFGTVSIDLLPMVVIAAVTLPLASWLFRNRLA